MTYERNNAMYQLYYSWEAHMQSLYVYTHAYMDLQYKYLVPCRRAPPPALCRPSARGRISRAPSLPWQGAAEPRQG